MNSRADERGVGGGYAQTGMVVGGATEQNATVRRDICAVEGCRRVRHGKRR